MEESPISMPDEDLNRLFETYLPKLVRMAENRISSRLKSKFDSDDVAGTVFRTVVRRFKEGKFKFEDDAEFWRLLVTIAKRKISNKVRHFNTQSRSIDGEVSEVASAILARPEPGPADAAAFEESLQILLGSLDDQERQIFLMRMEGHDFHEIGDLLVVPVSERTVRRKMKLIREKLGSLFFGGDLESER